MKKTFLISIITIVLFSFVMIQCTKENTNEINTSKENNIEFRSNISIGGEVLSPTCDIFSDLPGAQCAPEDTVTKIITSPNGCNVRVTMHVKFCADFANNDINIEFSDLNWSLTSPFSLGCQNWWMSLFQAQQGQQNQMLDDFEEYIEQAFEDEYMTDYVIDKGISCNGPFEYASTYFYKSPCTQRCMTPPGSIDEPFFTYTTPCADDGCCGKYTSYCLNEDGSIIKDGPNTYQITACTLFHPVDCYRETIQWGDCTDDGCE
jgi:hypothetical protein